MVDRITLPIENIKNDLLAALESHSLILLTAPPGAGKSTLLPLWLLTSLKNKQTHKTIYLLQPRRVAAKNIACYLAEQLGEPVGETVGYRLRNETKVSKHTQLEVITEGILVRIMQNNPELEHCDLIIFDEFHERSVQADIAFAFARDIQQGLRDDLTLLLMSATMATSALQKKLPDAKTLTCEGRSFPIQYRYNACQNFRFWRDHTLSNIQQQLPIHQGSILVFLPSSGDIRWLAGRLTGQLPNNYTLYTLYGDMPLKAQQQAMKIEPVGQYKIVLATNIAETSLTIDGINLVIDTGLEKVASFDSNTLTNQLKQQTICKAAAIQRAGRAGRLMAGECIRLYAEDDFQRRPEQSALAIEQADLIPLLLDAAHWGVTALDRLPLLDLPNAIKEQKAWYALQQLKIIDEKKRLTALGQQAAKLSCHPRFAYMILKAKTLLPAINISKETKKFSQKTAEQLASLACFLAAILEEKDIFAGEYNTGCDITLRLRVLTEKNNKAFRHISQRIFKQAKALAKQANITFTDAFEFEQTGLLLCLAYPEQLAQARSIAGEYLTQSGKGVVMHVDDKLASSAYIVVAQASQTQQSIYIRLAAEVNIQQLIEQNIVHINTEQRLYYDEKNARIVAKKVECLGAIHINEQIDNRQLNSEKVGLLWCDYIKSKGLNVLNWQTDDTKLLARLQWLNQYQKIEGFPDFSDSFLRYDLDQWLSPYVGECLNKRQLDKVNLSALLMARLEYAQQQLLNKLAPEKYVGPTGRHCRIRYGVEKSPILSLPMQEVYGLSHSPCVGSNQYGEEIPLTLELLSPAGRPIQMTQNLAGFWQGSYKDVQKEMKGRYPKHYWPDDPANAVATAKTKKYM